MEEFKPALREFVFRAVVSSDDSVEVIQLLAQVMDSYSPHLPNGQKEAVVAWFVKANS